MCFVARSLEQFKHDQIAGQNLIAVVVDQRTLLEHRHVFQAAKVRDPDRPVDDDY
jgi:hypothetical protein